MELFSKKNIRATLFVSIFWFSYDVAFYGIGLFNPTILEIFGLTKNLAVLGSAVFAVFAVLGSFLCIAFIDRLGRKKITALGFAGMAVSLLFLGIIALLVPKSAFTDGGVAAAIVALFIVFEVTQTMGPGGTDFVYPQEVFPTSIRATLCSLELPEMSCSTFFASSLFPTWASHLALSGTETLNMSTITAGMMPNANMYLHASVPSGSRRNPMVYATADPTHHAETFTASSLPLLFTGENSEMIVVLIA